MTPRQIAVELFKIPSDKREARLNAIQYPDRWQVEQYIENFARQARGVYRQRQSDLERWAEFYKQKLAELEQ